MRQMLTIAVIVFTMLATCPLGGFAQSGAAEGRETLTRALHGAWLPLESGLVVSAREGTPLSAKYEIDVIHGGHHRLQHRKRDQGRGNHRRRRPHGGTGPEGGDRAREARARGGHRKRGQG